QGVAYVRFDEQMTRQIEQQEALGVLQTKSFGLGDLAAELGVRSMKRMFPDAGEFEARHREAGLHKWYVVSYDENVPVTKANQGLACVPGVEVVEECRAVKSSAVFNDPKFGQQWHYYNDGSISDRHSAGCDVNVLPVWKNYTVGKPEVIVAVVDGGVDSSHEDMAGVVIGGYDFVNDIGKVTPMEHGTHVAGTIAAVNNNGIGVCGVAGGDYAKGKEGVKILSCQIFYPNPQDPSKEISGGSASAIVWGADHGAVISQNSWGFVYSKESDAEAATISPSLKTAIDYFIKNAGCDASGKQVGPMKGGVVIFAAGNDAFRYNPICEYDPVISVGSVGPDFARASYSNYGDWVDIAAPGGMTSYSGGGVLSTVPGNKYSSFQGTSMACPHVSGVAALIVSYFGGQGFTNDMLVEKLLSGANYKALASSQKIGPLVDALGSITYGSTIPPSKVEGLTVSSVSNNIDMSWKVPSDPDDKKAYGFIMLAAKSKSELSGVNPSDIPSTIKTGNVATGDLSVGDSVQGRISGLDFDTDYYSAVFAYDYNRNYSPISDIKSVRTKGNNPPVITPSVEGKVYVKSHETVNISISVSDIDGHTFSVSCKTGSDAAEFSQLPSGEWQLSITGNVVEPGLYKAVVEAVDSYNAQSELIIEYEILENHAPEIVKEIEDKLLTMLGEKYTLDMAEYLHDPDGEQLKFSISISNKTVLHINPSDNILHATALGYGRVDVVITATDSRGLSCTLPFSVAVKDSEKPVEIYPSQVKDYLTISTMEEAETSIEILSVTGKSLYHNVSPVSVFDPAVIDMTGFAPGQYMVKVEIDGNRYDRNIVKL
ncbi:MAG: S8 family serine peptidase, partial [Candidatus Cryptobacteroides sp.]